MRAVAVTSNFRSRNFFRITLSCIVLAIALLLCGQVRANEGAEETAAVRTEFNKIYSQLLRNPSDVELTLIKIDPRAA